MKLDTLKAWAWALGAVGFVFCVIISFTHDGFVMWTGLVGEAAAALCMAGYSPGFGRWFHAWRNRRGGK